MATLDYAPIAKRIDAALRKVGVPVKVTRNGSAVGAGYGVFVERKNSMDTTEPLMQTTVRQRVLKLSGLAKPPAIGDTITVDKDEFTVSSVETTRPTTVTLVYTLELT